MRIKVKCKPGKKLYAAGQWFSEKAQMAPDNFAIQKHLKAGRLVLADRDEDTEVERRAPDTRRTRSPSTNTIVITQGVASTNTHGVANG